MRELPVDIGKVVMAMTFSPLESQSFLDLETGEVITLDEELLDEERVLDPDFLEESEWEEAEVEAAQAIAQGDERYVPIPEFEAQEAYDLRVEFTEGLEDERTREALLAALDGPGAFGRWKRLLGQHPEERERWFRFEDTRLRAVAREWLEEIGVRPMEPPRD